MANLLKKKFIGNDQVDGSKILLENDQFFRVKLQDGTIKNLLKVDATDKLILSDAPIISTPGTDASSVQTKAQLDSAVSAEASIRSAADVAIQAEVDAVETGLAQEITDRTNADSALSTAITAEQTRATGEESRIEGKVDTEKARAEAAEALLIPLTQKGAANGVAPLNGNGLIESQFLPSFVDDVLEFADLASFPAEGENGKMYLAIDSGKIYRWSGSTYIEISSNEVNSVFGRVGNVVAVAGDYNTAQVTEDPSALFFTDARAIAALAPKNLEQDNRLTAVEGRATDLEASVADHETRIEAMENEVPAWYNIKKALIVDDINNGYVDLDHEIVPGSLVAFVDRLAIHQGAAEDYTLSVVNEKTRVTFVNSLVAPGLEALAAGDNLYFKYQF